jgi:hypothetical protein
LRLDVSLFFFFLFDASDCDRPRLCFFDFLRFSLRCSGLSDLSLALLDRLLFFFFGFTVLSGDGEGLTSRFSCSSFAFSFAASFAKFCLALRSGSNELPST